MGAGENAKGITIGMIGAGAGEDAIGLTIGGLGCGAGENMIGLQAALLGMGAGENLSGINLAGLGMGAGSHLKGISVVGLGAGAPKVSGITIAGIGSGGQELKGIFVSGALIKVVDDGQLTGFAASAFNQIKGTQKGVSLGIVNYTYKLKGFQIGLINIVRDNPKYLRILPLINWNFSD